MNRLSTAAVLLALLASAAHAAPERVTPLVVNPTGDVLEDSYVWESVETVNGHLPVVDHVGKRAVKIHVKAAANGNGFGVGIAYSGWSKFYVGDYVPEGTMQFDLAGTPGPETTVTIVDAGKRGDGPDAAVRATVKLPGYVKAGDGWRHVSIPITDFVAASPRIDLENLAQVVFQGPQATEQTFYFTDLKFTTTHPERTYPPVKVDQVGYPVGWAKIAKVTPPDELAAGAAFTVNDAASARVAFRGKLKVAALHDAESGDNVYDADFTPLDTPGTYVVEVQGLDRSAPFRIGPDPYKGLLVDLVRMFYFQRCGMELPAKYAGADAHRACHLSDNGIPDLFLGGMRNCSGGWHDAGDMNRYMEDTIQPLFVLLTLYREYPQAFPDGQMNIPESGNGVSDLLDEVKYELAWTRKMLIRTGPNAGQVYGRIHESLVQQPPKVSAYDQLHGLAMPTDAAACAFVSDMSLASVVYRDVPLYKQFADDCLQDAQLTWKYLTTEGKPPEKEMINAAALLFEATGSEDANARVGRLSDSVMKSGRDQLIWSDFDAGLVTYALSGRPEVDKQLQARIRAYLKAAADDTLKNAHSRGYETPMMSGVDYVWGSNGRLARTANEMLFVSRFAPNPAYVAAARQALHLLLGCNAIDQCMITGYGTPPLGPLFSGMYGPMGPGHPPMPPGYLAGGVDCSGDPGISLYKAKDWRDDWTNFDLSEMDITYQGPMVYLLGALTADEGH